VNLALAAIDSLYGYLGMEPAVVRREQLPAKVPRTLASDDPAVIAGVSAPQPRGSRLPAYRGVYRPRGYARRVGAVLI
jgi:hypothetical protein